MDNASFRRITAGLLLAGLMVTAACTQDEEAANAPPTITVVGVGKDGKVAEGKISLNEYRAMVERKTAASQGLEVSQHGLYLTTGGAECNAISRGDFDAGPPRVTGGSVGGCKWDEFCRARDVWVYNRAAGWEARNSPETVGLIMGCFRADESGDTIDNLEDAHFGFRESRPLLDWGHEARSLWAGDRPGNIIEANRQKAPGFGPYDKLEEIEPVANELRQF